MLRVSNIKMPIEHDIEMVKLKASKTLRINLEIIKQFKISGKSIDARKKDQIVYVYSVDVKIPNEAKYASFKDVKIVEPYEYVSKNLGFTPDVRPVVVGSGPAGIFAALILAEHGLCPIILERGKDVDSRKNDVYNFFEKGELNIKSNVQFGEGGAGTFSDGKLTTNTHDERIAKVIEELIKTGANEEITYLQKPHVGTDKLIGIMKNMRARIECLGGEYRFCNKLVSINHIDEKLESIDVENNDETYNLECENLILALGHSARDTFRMLYEKGLKIVQKPFAVGVRIEHKQEFINNYQYGKFAKQLKPAEYKLNTKLLDGRGVFTFCMCPGGQVVAAASEENRLVTNGMSYSNRDLQNANAALLVNVDSKDFGSDSPLAGIDFQEKLEEKAFEVGGGNYFAPVQLVGDFLKGKKSENLGEIKPSYKPGYTLSDLSLCFPENITNALKDGLLEMDKKIKGFASDDAILTAVESRSSSPVRIVRNNEMVTSIAGVMACGEGAGYAGGIVSAAVDGIKCAEFLCKIYKDLLIEKKA